MIVDSLVTRVSFDHAVELLFGDGGVVHIEGRGSLRCRDGQLLEFDAECASAIASEILELLHHEVRVEALGSVLSVATEGGPSLEVHPSDDFEAWTVAAGDGRRYVCAPGGEVVRWPQG